MLVSGDNGAAKPSAPLSAEQRAVLSSVLSRLAATQYDRPRLQREIRDYLEILNGAFPGEQGLFLLCRDLEWWVRWTRLPGYCLAFLAQMLAVSQQSWTFPLAAGLYADSQMVVGDDFAISSLESAYACWQRNLAQMPDLPDGKRILAHLKSRLNMALGSYQRWRKRFAFEQCNPLAEHLYSQLTWSYVATEVDAGSSQGTLKSAARLASLVGQCGSEDRLYYRIVARRFLGLEHEGAGRWPEALEQYETALAEARETGLEAEIGHLLRHRGFALRSLKRYDESTSSFEEACEWESAPQFTYWRALSESERGLALCYEAGEAGVESERRKALLRQALGAYREARKRLDIALAFAVPEVRDVQQELFRVFSENALHLANLLGAGRDVLAQTEACGPRLATEVVCETLAAKKHGPASLAEYLDTRSTYYRQAETYSCGIDTYTSGLPGSYEARKKYLALRQKLDRSLYPVHASDAAADQVLHVEAPDCMFILPHLGLGKSWVTCLDFSRRSCVIYESDFTVLDAGRAYDKFRNLIDPMEASGEACLKAVDELLEAYESWLVPLLKRALEHSRASRLKFFLREEMNAAPLHALPYGNGRLLDNYEVSYGQTVAVWLQGQGSPEAPAGACSLLMAYSDQDTPFYEPLAQDVQSGLLGEASCLRNASASALFSAAQKANPTDLVFACHGSFDPVDAGNSCLMIAGQTGVSFYDLFSGLNLSQCRSVILGACVSGRVRTAVGAEYYGLPLAFLSAGARNVVSSLWPVNQISTALLVERLVAGLAQGQGVALALRKAQRSMVSTTAEEVAEWLETRPVGLPRDLVPGRAVLRKLGKYPFAHPYYWAGLEVTGE